MAGDVGVGFPRVLRTVNTRVIGVARRLWAIGGHRWAYPAVLVIFAVTAVFFSVAIQIPALQGVDNGVPFVAKFSRVPDEFRHIGNILFYVEQPLAAGPFLSDVHPDALWLGEVERFPSYLYYYLLSFPARLLVSAGVGHEGLVIVLRLLTAATGLGCLVVLRRLLQGLGAHRTVVGWSLLALTLTGRFVWQSAAVSYDIPAMLLFAEFLLAGVRLLERVTVAWLLVLVLTAAPVSITKYTFMPFVAVGAVALLGWLVLRHWGSWSEVLRAMGAEIREHRPRTLLLAGVAAVAVALFVERLVLNVVVYGAANPDCATIHSSTQCMSFDIYRRNAQALEDHLGRVASGESDPLRLSPFGYVGTWLDL